MGAVKVLAIPNDSPVVSEVRLLGIVRELRTGARVHMLPWRLREQCIAEGTFVRPS